MRSIKFGKSEILEIISFHRYISWRLINSYLSFFLDLSLIFLYMSKIFQRSLTDTVYKHASTELRFNAPEMFRPYAIPGHLDPPARGRAFPPRAACILL